jgi:hypothetical protein
MFLKPASRQFRDTVQRAGLFEQMSGAGDDLQPPFRLVRELRNRPAPV